MHRGRKPGGSSREKKKKSKTKVYREDPRMLGEPKTPDVPLRTCTSGRLSLHLERHRIGCDADVESMSARGKLFVTPVRRNSRYMIDDRL